jgi:hypothetical protein
VLALDVDIAAYVALTKYDPPVKQNDLVEAIYDAAHNQTRILVAAFTGQDIGDRPRPEQPRPVQQSAGMKFDEQAEFVGFDEGVDVFVDGQYRGRYGAGGDMSINEDLPPLNPSGGGDAVHVGAGNSGAGWQTQPTPRVIGADANSFYSQLERRTIRKDDPNVI